MTRPAMMFLILAGATALSGCGTIGQLKTIGKAPKLSEMTAVDTPLTEDSLGQPSRRPTAPPLALAPPDASLFRAGAGAFLGDQRAARKGDILTVRINVQDRAEVGNTTARTRGGSENAGLTAALGLGVATPDPLIAGNSKSQFNGSGNISRSETISMTMSIDSNVRLFIRDVSGPMLPEKPVSHSLVISSRISTTPSRTVPRGLAAAPAC